MNQVEIWLSILMRKLLKRGNFTSVEHLKTKVLAFVEYFNRTVAKPSMDLSGQGPDSLNPRLNSAEMY